MICRKDTHNMMNPGHKIAFKGRSIFYEKKITYFSVKRSYQGFGRRQYNKA